MIFVLAALIMFFQIVTGGLTLTSDNVINLFNGNAYVLILAIGMVLVVIAGHIDLSVGSVAAFVGIVVAQSMSIWNLPWYLAIALGLVLGAIIGAWQGFWVAYVGVPAFIATLAGMLFFRGANQFVGNSASVPVPEAFRSLGAGFLPEIGPVTGYNNLTVILGLLVTVFLIIRQIMSRRRGGRFGATLPPVWVTLLRIILISGLVLSVTGIFATGRPGTSFPIPGLILAVLIVFYGFIAQKTLVGRRIYAVGGNKKAAELSGVNGKAVDFLVMANMGVLAALAGMIFVARSSAAGPADGLGWELDAIAAVFIGGAAVSGGVGTVLGAFIGGLVMAVLNNGLQLLGVGADLTQMIKGLVLLLAVAVDVYNKSQGRPSIMGLLARAFRQKPVLESVNQSSPAPDPGDASRGRTSSTD